MSNQRYKWFGRPNRERPISHQNQGDSQPDPSVPSAIAWEPSSLFVKYCITTLFVGSAIAMLALHLIVPEQQARLLAPILIAVFSLIGWVLHRRGHVRVTVLLLLAALWLVVTAAAFYTGGVRAPVMVAYPVLILVAAWTVGTAAAIAITLASMAASLVFFRIEIAGYLPTFLPSSPAIHVGDQIVIFAIASGLAIFIFRAYRSQITALHEASLELAARAQELEINRAELQRAQSVGQVGSWVYELATDQVRLTQEAAHLLGLAGRTCVNLQEFFAPVLADDRAALDAAWEKALRGATFDVEHRIVRGGELRWMRQIASLEFDAHGKACRALGTLQDTTARRQAEEALRESEFLWKFAIAGARDGVWDWDLKTNEMTFSALWREIMGYALDDPTPNGEQRKEQIHPLDRARVTEALQAYLAGDTAVYSVECRFQCKDGSYKWCLGRGMVVSRDAQGAPLRMIGTTTDISERKRMEEQVQHLAFYDALTNLPNRRLLKDRMQQAMSSSKRLGSYCALMFLDMDNFKPLNDAHGHDAGDLLLSEVAKRLKLCVREVDSVARFGGDEFVVMLVELGGDQTEALAHAARVAEKIRVSLSDSYTVPLHNMPCGTREVVHHCTVSIGVTLFLGQEASQDDVLKNADKAMYLAKQEGRNKVHLLV